MPSNAELTSQITELAEKLGVTVETKDLKNAELSDLLSDLKAKERDAELTTQADESTDGEDTPPADDEPEVVELPPFSVAPGKAITSKRGILDSGSEVKADDLAGGKESLKSLIKSGHVIEN